MPVLNLHNFSTFLLWFMLLRRGALISKQPVFQYYTLNCEAKECFQNHTWLKVSLM